jgi:stage IV sporulation protein FB
MPPTRSAFHLGSIRGTTIQVQSSFLVLMGFFILLDLESHVPLREALLWIPVLLISVLVHELGHAALIGAFHFGPSQISLSSFGGLTLNRRHARPWQDMLISLAGPATSFLLAALASTILLTVSAARADPMVATLLPIMASANLLWGKFNLLPMFPLDGGQALRSFFVMFTTERRATMASIVISFIAGIALLGYSLLIQQFVLAIISGILLMQNYQRWQIYRATAPPPETGQ